MKDTRWPWMVGIAAVGIVLVVLFTRSGNSVRTRTEQTNSGTDALDRKVEFLEEESRPRLAVRRPETAGEPAPPKPSTWQRLLAGDPEVCRLPREMVEAYVAKNQTNAESLLAAFQATGDMAFLKSAATNFPNDPAVLFQVVTRDAFPEARRQWLDQFKQAAPDNALANYLSAREYFKSGQPELALNELLEATQKRQFHDYTAEKIQSLEEMYLQAGKSVAESKALSMWSVPLPQLQQLRDLSREMTGLHQQYLGAGDTASADAMARVGLTLGRQLSAGQGANYLINQLVGLGIEKEFYGRLDPAKNYDFLRQPVADRLAQIQAQRQTFRNASQAFEIWLPTANEGEVVAYYDRLKLYGEAAALAWLQNRQGAR